MDKKASRRIVNFKHLNALSVYARSVAFNAKASLQDPVKVCSPFINFKIEVVNICAKKRKLDETFRDEGYETPPKQPFSPATLSPDLGCVMDYYSPTDGHCSVSRFPSLLDDSQDIKSESERGDLVLEVGQGEQVKEMHLDANNKDSFCVSSNKDITVEQNLPGCSHLATETSTPLHRASNAKVSRVVIL